MTAKLKQLFIDYGFIAIVIHFSIFFLTWGGFYLALTSGMDLTQWEWLPEFVATGGNIAISYVITQALKPIRLALTLILTPLLGRIVMKRRAVKQSESDDSNGDVTEKSLE